MLTCWPQLIPKFTFVHWTQKFIKFAKINCSQFSKKPLSVYTNRFSKKIGKWITNINGNAFKSCDFIDLHSKTLKNSLIRVFTLFFFFFFYPFYINCKVLLMIPDRCSVVGHRGVAAEHGDQHRPKLEILDIGNWYHSHTILGFRFTVGFTVPHIVYRYNRRNLKSWT